MDFDFTYPRTYSVGERYKEFANGEDGFRVEWNNTGGLTLFATMNRLTLKEELQFQVAEPLTVRYTTIDKCCFFTFKFGNLDWADSPFAPALYEEAGEKFDLEPFTEGKGLALTILLFDSYDGELRAIRLVGLGHEFSEKWREWALSAARKKLSRSDYDNTVDSTYNRYSCAALADRAKFEGNEYIVPPYKFIP